MPLRDDLAPLLEFRLSDWRGLPQTHVEDVVEVFGPANETTTVELGYYPAIRSKFASEAPSGGFYAYARQSRVVMIETLKQPPVTVLGTLPTPMGVLPNELLLQGVYAHEYLYGERGLVLTVAVPYGSQEPREIVRCRGFAPIASAREFGAELYRPFEDRVLF